MKLTPKTIQDVISGKIQVSNYRAIQAAASYLRRVQGTSTLAKGGKQYEQEEIKLLKNYISKNNLWESTFIKNIISKPSDAQGMEQKVYLKDENTVIKLNDSVCYLCWEDYFNSLLLHNLFFYDTSYELIGFTEIENKIHSIVQQPLIKATSITDLTKVKTFLLENGFKNIRNNDYYNPELEITLEDLHDENVLTKENILYFIDTIFFIDKPKLHKQGGNVNMTQLKKSDMSVEEIKQEIEKAQKNTLLPNNLKKKYIAMMEAKLPKEEKLTDERGDKYSINHIQLKNGKAYFASMPVEDVTYNQKNKLSWYNVTVIGVTNMRLGEIVLSKENFKKLAEIVNPRIITVAKLKKGGTIKKGVPALAKSIAYDHKELIEREKAKSARLRKK